MERVGIFGGTFDPIHHGHIVGALSARHQLNLDVVMMMVAADPWQKRDQVHASALDRFELVQLACQEIDGLIASDLELLRDGPTYTIDTVELLESVERELVLIVGEDAASNVASWHRWPELQAKVTIAVLNRPGSRHDSNGDPSGLGIAVQMPDLAISSSEIRRRIASRAPIDGLVPLAVVHRIALGDLYNSP